MKYSNGICQFKLSTTALWSFGSLLFICTPICDAGYAALKGPPNCFVPWMDITSLFPPRYRACFPSPMLRSANFGCPPDSECRQTSPTIEAPAIPPFTCCTKDLVCNAIAEVPFKPYPYPMHWQTIKCDLGGLPRYVPPPPSGLFEICPRCVLDAMNPPRLPPCPQDTNCRQLMQPDTRTLVAPNEGTCCVSGFFPPQMFQAVVN